MKCETKSFDSSQLGKSIHRAKVKEIKVTGYIFLCKLVLRNDNIGNS